MRPYRLHQLMVFAQKTDGVYSDIFAFLPKFETFNKVGHEDPLNKFQQYSGGFKSYLKSLNDTKGLTNETDLIVNAVHFNEAAPLESQDSGYTSPHR